MIFFQTAAFQRHLFYERSRAPARALVLFTSFLKPFFLLLHLLLSIAALINELTSSLLTGALTLISRGGEKEKKVKGREGKASLSSSVIAENFLAAAATAKLDHHEPRCSEEWWRF